MSNKKIMIILMFFVLLGSISLVNAASNNITIKMKELTALDTGKKAALVGPVKDDIYNATIVSLWSAPNGDSVFINGTSVEGKPINSWVDINSTVPNKYEIYTTLNNAYWTRGTVIVAVKNGKVNNITIKMKESTAVGPVKDDIYKAIIVSLCSAPNGDSVFINGTSVEGKPINSCVDINSTVPNKGEIYTTLNTAYWTRGTVIVAVKNGKVYGTILTAH
jgi:hypothetical protein